MGPDLAWMESGKVLTFIGHQVGLASKCDFSLTASHLQHVTKQNKGWSPSRNSFLDLGEQLAQIQLSRFNFL